MRNVENVVGGSSNDAIRGDALANALTGGAGIDSLAGNKGEHTRDTIRLDGKGFKELGRGELDDSDFGIGTGKAVKDRHAVYYNEKTGALFYDANGKQKDGDGARGQAGSGPRHHRSRLRCRVAVNGLRFRRSPPVKGRPARRGRPRQQGSAAMEPGERLPIHVQ